MTTTELTKTIRELKELKAYRDKLDRDIDERENAVKAEMDAQGVEEMRVDIFKVAWKKIADRPADFDELRHWCP
jgi:hypothetical protein